SVRDEEHQLNMEISENENRKEFTYSERMDWSKRLGRIESIKARERQGKRTDLTSGKTLSDVRADDVVAEKSGFGSREQYRKAKFIDEHADEETIKKLDEEKISIHRAWTETKEKLEQAEKRAKQAESQAENERKERERLEEELENQEPERVEVVPDDYDFYKGNYESAVNLQKRYKDQMEEMRKELNETDIKGGDEEDRLRKREKTLKNKIKSIEKINDVQFHLDDVISQISTKTHSLDVNELLNDYQVLDDFESTINEVINVCKELKNKLPNKNIIEGE